MPELQRNTALRWPEWLEQYEEEVSGRCRAWIIESMLYHLFDFDYYHEDHYVDRESYKAEAASRLLFMLEFASPTTFPLSFKDTSRYDLSPRPGHDSLRQSAVGFLSSRFFTRDRRPSLRSEPAALLARRDVAVAVWKFWTIPANIPVVPSLREKLVGVIRAEYLNSIRHSWDKEIKRHILETLINVDLLSLQLMLDAREMSHEMIEVIGDFLSDSGLGPRHPQRFHLEAISETLHKLNRMKREFERTSA